MTIRRGALKVSIFTMVLTATVMVCKSLGIYIFTSLDREALLPPTMTSSCLLKLQRVGVKGTERENPQKWLARF